MKNINLIINGVLAAAVIVLFVLYFGEAGEKVEEGGSGHVQTTLSQGELHELRIAYFNIDSVLANWDLYYQVQEELAAKQSSLESEFGSKQQAFMSSVEDAQYKIQRGLVTRAEAEQLQQNLAEEEQRLLAMQNQFGLEMQEEGVVKNRQMVDKIEQYLVKFNETHGYTYIFSYAFGGNLLYGDDAYNITDLVIEGINEEYAAEEKE